MNPLVSIIIPIRPGENTDQILSAVYASAHKNFEIIIIDMGLERSAQRNAGINRAKGEYLLILDSDQYPHKYLIDECLALVEDLGADAIYIPEVIKTKGWFGYVRNWERQFYTATPIDVVRFVKAKGCPRFDESMSGPEDSDWDRRVIGQRAISRFPLYHYDNVSLVGYFRKKAYYSRSMARYAEKNPGDKVLNFWWRCFGVFLENGKWKRFLARPDLALCVLFLIFIRGVVYHANKPISGDIGKLQRLAVSN